MNIRRLAIGFAACCSCWLASAAIQSAEPATETAVEPVLAPALQPFVDRQTLSGAVALVSDKEKTLDVETVGFADIAAKKPMAPDSLFWIASMTKPMTAAALMTLVDEGKVKLDDPVEKYLPAFKGQMYVAEKNDEQTVLKKPAKPVTVRNILSHTSGLVSNSPIEPRLDKVPLAEATTYYGASPLKFEPGSKYEYNNPGINTAGMIIEAVSGRPYDVYMQHRLFNVLGMKDTAFVLVGDQDERLAKTYKPNEKKDGLEEGSITYLTYPLVDPHRYAFPGGGLFSSAEDVAIFCRMILNGGMHDGKRFLSENAVREMTSTQTGNLIDKEHGQAGYGLGWSTSKTSAGDSGPVIPGVCGHGGAFSTNMTIDPDNGLIYVYLTQHAGYANDDGGKILPTFHEAAKKAFGKR